MGWWDNYIICLCIFLSLPFVSAAIEINEVMYAPSEAVGGQYNEWLELFNSDSEDVNLSLCFLDGQPLPSLIIPPHDYVIIARKPDLFLKNYLYNHTVIEQSLSFYNDKPDTIVLNGTCSSQVNYTFSKESYNYVGDFQKDHTLERRSDGTWEESMTLGGSPGRQNSIWDIETISSNISTNTSFNVTIPLPETESCNIKLSLVGEPIINSTNLNFSITAENTGNTSIDITVKGKIEDLEGKTIKEYSPWTNRSLSKSLQQKYSPSIDTGAYLVTFSLENMSCTNRDPSDNTVQKIFARPPVPLPSNSTISIENISLGSDRKARWGEQLSVRLKVYKGNETKNEVRLWAESESTKVSKTTSFLLSEKYHTSSLTLPLQLDSQCETKNQPDQITIIVAAFGQHVEERVSLSDLPSSLCKTVSSPTTVSTNSSSRTSRAASITLDAPPSVRAGSAVRITAKVKGAVTSASSLNYKLSGSIYSGKKCYSCANNTHTPDHDSESLSLGSAEEQEQDLLLKVDPTTKEGKYKVKVFLQQEDLKTPKTATLEIYVLPLFVENTLSTRNSSTPLLSSPSPPPLTAIPTLEYSPLPNPISQRGIIVYESTSAKAKRATPYFLIISLALLTLSISFRKT